MNLLQLIFIAIIYAVIAIAAAFFVAYGTAKGITYGGGININHTVDMQTQSELDAEFQHNYRGDYKKD